MADPPIVSGPADPFNPTIAELAAMLAEAETLFVRESLRNMIDKNSYGGYRDPFSVILYPEMPK